MTDVYAGHSQFILLTDNRRRWFDGRTLFLITVVTVPIIIFCGIYTIVSKGNEALLYPKSRFEVPSLLKHRAKIYGNLEKTFKSGTIQIDEVAPPQIEEFKLICYYNFPSDDPNTLQPKNIDPFLCTHINAGFAYISENTVALSDSQLEQLKSVVALKEVNKDLKVLLSVGGAGDHSGFDTMVTNHTNRKAFIHSVLDLVKSVGIDGVDLDWEFPNRNQHGDKNQRMHFVQLLEEIRSTINKQERHKFLLTVAAGAPAIIVDDSYDVSYMDTFVDFINLMTYDFHFFSTFTPFTGINSPLYPSFEDKGYFTTLNINYSGYYWISKGMSRGKIMVGLPTYGHTFRLTNTHNKGLYAPARSYGKLGSLGFADYTQICKFLNLNQISPNFDTHSKSPYACKGSEWVSYDNEQSLAFKTEFVRNNQFGGVMIYSLNSDDHMGACKLDPNIPNQPFPLVRKVREILDKNYSII